MKYAELLQNAGVAQLAEHDVANVVVEGSNPFARFFKLVMLKELPQHLGVTRCNKKSRIVFRTHGA